MTTTTVLAPGRAADTGGTTHETARLDQGEGHRGRRTDRSRLPATGKPDPQRLADRDRGTVGQADGESVNTLARDLDR
jgi:hypothetical protein